MACTSLPRILLTSTIWMAGIAAIGIPVASAAPPSRITSPISNNNPVAVAGSVHPLVGVATDLGPEPANTRLSMSIRFSRTPAQEAALDQLLADQQDPTSPLYHQWLTPAQFAAQFGLSASDLAKVTGWLASQGFTVTAVSNSATFVVFEGTVAQAQAAFGTTIRSMSRNGEMHFANVTDVQVPAAMAGVVLDVTGLHNFRLRPRALTSTVHPQFTSSLSGSHFLAPSDINTIYNIGTLSSAGGGGIGTGANCKATAAPGTGVVPACGDIAVVGQVDIVLGDISAFRTAAGLSTTNLPTTIHAFGIDPGNALSCQSCLPGPSQNDLEESSIDVEWAGAMAPTATIAFVNGGSVLPGGSGTDSMTFAVDTNLAPIISTSYGNCEAGWGTADLTTTNNLFKQANAQGQTILAAAGDSGATDCDTGASPSLGEAIEGWNVDFPGSSPYVTSMGGTQFNGDAAATCTSGACNTTTASNWGATTYWAGTPNSTDVISSALSYIPEAAWNDATAGFGFGGGGGGPSAFFTKPAWQVGTAVDGSRDVPDISLDAADSHDPFLYCVNVAAGVSCSGNTFRETNTDLTVAGGTSFDSQIFAGLLALIEQKNGGGRLGNINPTLYALGNSSTYAPLVFHDVTTGGNQMPCVASTPNCGSGGSTGFSTSTGYDLATGWGSVNMTNLATDWTKVTPLGNGALGTNASITQLVASPITIAAGASSPVTLTATVTGAVSTPTGSVQFFVNNTALGSAVTLSGTPAISAFSWTPTCANLGQNVMTAVYSGDATYQGSKGPTLPSGGYDQIGGTSQASNGSIIVTPIEVQVTTNNCPDFSISASATSETVAAGGTLPPVTITAAATNGFTGTITFSATVSSTTGYAPTVTFTPASITLPSSTTTTTMTLTGITAALHLPSAPGKVDAGPVLAKRTAPPAAGKWGAAGSGVAIASLLFLVLPRRRRRLGGLLLVALAVAIIGGVTGCGGSSQSGPPGSGNSNPYAGTYYINVVATYTSTGGQVTTHSQQITYTVN